MAKFVWYALGEPRGLISVEEDADPDKPEEAVVVEAEDFETAKKLVTVHHECAIGDFGISWGLAPLADESIGPAGKSASPARIWAGGDGMSNAKPGEMVEIRGARGQVKISEHQLCVLLDAARNQQGNLDPNTAQEMIDAVSDIQSALGLDVRGAAFS